MRLVVASCSARYSGRLNAHLPLATRLVVVKADGSVLLHSDGGSYKPLNWMSPPCSMLVSAPDAEAAEPVHLLMSAEAYAGLTSWIEATPSRVGSVI